MATLRETSEISTIADQLDRIDEASNIKGLVNGMIDEFANGGNFSDSDFISRLRGNNAGQNVLMLEVINGATAYVIVPKIARPVWYIANAGVGYRPYENMEAV